jgi:hypothetical protein
LVKFQQNSFRSHTMFTKSLKFAALSSVLLSSTLLANTTETTERKLPPAVKFNFTSIGEGIDYNFLQNVQKVAGAMLASGALVGYEMVPVKGAREGEKTVCVEFGTSEQVALFYKEIFSTSTKRPETVGIESALNCK